VASFDCVAYRQLWSWLPSYKNQQEKRKVFMIISSEPKSTDPCHGSSMKSNKLLSRILQGHDLSEE
jgi:hypothetical protein